MNALGARRVKVKRIRLSLLVIPRNAPVDTACEEISDFSQAVRRRHRFGRAVVDRIHW